MTSVCLVCPLSSFTLSSSARYRLLSFPDPVCLSACVSLALATACDPTANFQISGNLLCSPNLPYTFSFDYYRMISRWFFTDSRWFRHPLHVPCPYTFLLGICRINRQHPLPLPLSSGYTQMPMLCPLLYGWLFGIPCLFLWSSLI